MSGEKASQSVLNKSIEAWEAAAGISGTTISPTSKLGGWKPSTLPICEDMLTGINNVRLEIPKAPKQPELAAGFLEEAVKQMVARGALRDTPNGERTAAQIAQVFNAITGHKLSEADAWMFLLVLKIVRSRSGKYSRDDYVDLAAYAGLLGEYESTVER